MTVSGVKILKMTEAGASHVYTVAYKGETYVAVVPLDPPRLGAVMLERTQDGDEEGYWSCSAQRKINGKRGRRGFKAFND